MNITGLFEDLDRLKEELFRAEDKFEEWKIRCKITSCLILIYFTKVGDAVVIAGKEEDDEDIL